MRIAIVGVGLIGGSLALSWRGREGVDEVVGVARREETLAEAASVGAVDQGTLSLEEGVRGASVVVVATPVRTIVPLVEAMAPHLAPGAVVTDVGSTKGEVCRGAWAALRGRKALFVGGHPMAGSEREGVLAADPYLFQNAPYILVPPDDCPDDALGRLETLVRATGARPLVMQAEEHDAIVATVSHLPHLVAAALVTAASRRAERYRNLLELAAGGFRDTTRVASGPEDVWTDIALSNVGEILEAIGVFEACLNELKDAVASRDGEGLTKALGASRRVRESLPAKSKGILGAVWDIVVHVVDRPGTIHQVTGILADAGINVIDIEILRVREGEGGTLRLAFERRPDMERAAALLSGAGYRVRSRGT